MASRQSEDSHHLPVLAEAVVALLITDTRGAYLDLTAGGGGHLKALAGSLENEARLYGIDVDPEAVGRVNRVLKGTGQFEKIVQAAFGDIEDSVEQVGDGKFDGILIDLGISSHQLDDPARGISFRFDGPLDMRFSPEIDRSAADLVNDLPEAELKQLLIRYGEERQASRIARTIVTERQKGMILTTSQLREIVTSIVREPHQTKSLARVFQALRIAVNRELEQLEKVLPASVNLLNEKGRLAVIAYHSLEDRLVKRFFQGQAKGVCTCPPQLPDCVCGARPSLKLVTRKPVYPDDAEISRNPRARSARLRVAERLA
jgi:16S rRNA (cytosine1402-N4)-methyltransferase